MSFYHFFYPRDFLCFLIFLNENYSLCNKKQKNIIKYFNSNTKIITKIHYKMYIKSIHHYKIYRKICNKIKTCFAVDCWILVLWVWFVSLSGLDLKNSLQVLFIAKYKSQPFNTNICQCFLPPKYFCKNILRVM